VYSFSMYVTFPIVNGSKKYGSCEEVYFVVQQMDNGDYVKLDYHLVSDTCPTDTAAYDVRKLVTKTCEYSPIYSIPPKK